MTARISTTILILWFAVSTHAQGIFRLGPQLKPIGAETNLWKSNATEIAQAIGLPARVHTNDVPWLFVLTPGQILGTDEEGNWVALSLPSWWPDPTQGSVNADATNTFTEPNTFTKRVVLLGGADIEGDLSASNLVADALVIGSPIPGSYIDSGIDAANVTEGVLDVDRLPGSVARTNEAFIGLLGTDQLTLGGVSRTTWPTGSEGSGDSYLTITTTNSTPFPLWTNAPATNVAEFVIADVVGEGPTNSAAFRLSAFTRNRDGTLNSWTNALEDFQSAGNPSAFWNISDGAAVLNVAGVANEFINWKAVLKQLSVIGGEPTPSGFEWIVQDRFNSGPLSTNWTLTQGLTNYVDGFHETSPLEGAGSLLITVPTTGTTASHVILEHTMVAGQSEAWAFFRMSVSALPSGDFELCRIGNSYVTLRSTGNLRLTHGSSVTSRTTSDVVAGNTYDIWLYYKQSTGTDGVLRLWRDTTASGDKANATMRTELTNGTSGSSAYRFRLSGTKSSSISSAIQVKLDLAYAAHSSFEVIP